MSRASDFSVSQEGEEQHTIVGKWSADTLQARKHVDMPGSSERMLDLIEHVYAAAQNPAGWSKRVSVPAGRAL